MDKVKVFLAVLKKHHFWVLVGLVLVLGLTIYIAAAADLQGRYQTRSKKLNDAVQQVRQIPQETDHPNEQKIKSWEVAKNSQKQRVFDSWKTLYDKQQKENPWPAKLGKLFLDMIKALKPDEEIPRQYCEIYQNFIQAELDPLFAIVDYRHPEPIEVKPGEHPGTMPGAMGPMGAMGGAGGMGGMLGMGGMGAPGMEGVGGAAGQNYKMVGTVDWNLQDRQRIKLEFHFPVRPSSARVRLAQEDYWVYQALLYIIKKTNGDASTHSAVAVKRINTMQIGRAAASAFGTAQSAALGGMGAGMGMGMEMGMGMGGPGAGMGMGGEGAMPGMQPGMQPGMGMPGGAMQGAGAEPGMGMPGGGAMGMPGGGAMGMDGGMMGPGGGPGMGGTGTAAMSPDDMLLNYRYVDQTYTPLPAGTAAPYTEFKMMPVYLNLVIDQRKIPDLLVECANSTMPVEIKKVRINPGSGNSALGTGGMGAPGMEGMGGPGSEGMGMPGMQQGMGGPGMGMGGPGVGMGGPGMGMGGAHMGAPGMEGGMMGMESGMGMGAGAGGIDTTKEGESPYEVVIELCGIIYIYNPPDLEKLATGTVSEKAIENATNAAGGPAAAEPGEPGPTATEPPPAAPATAPGTLPAEAPGTPAPATGVPPTSVAPTPATPVAPTPAAPTPAAPTPAAPTPAAPTPAAPAAGKPAQP